VAEVFINYRTGDAEWVAAQIELYLSNRFGKEHVFKASRSIPPGAAFPEELLAGVRDCDVLLAVMGPDSMPLS
jgi:TIR domain